MSRVVAHNLRHQQLWHDVSEFQTEKFEFCVGVPPKKLHPDDPPDPGAEYVLISYTAGKWTVEQWAQAFAALAPKSPTGEEPQRIVMAMITDDSTIVYYIVYNGLQVPRKH